MAINYSNQLQQLNVKLERQRAAQRSTEELIAALKALAAQDEAKNATTSKQKA